MKDIYSKTVWSSDKNAFVITDTFGNKTVSIPGEELVEVSGRMCVQPNRIVAQRENGDFFTPIVHTGGQTAKYYGVGSCTYYKGDGKTRLNLERNDEVVELKHLAMPKLISNPDDNIKAYTYLIGFKEHALFLANLPYGSDLIVKGYFQSCMIGKKKIEVLIVSKIERYKEGGRLNGNV